MNIHHLELFYHVVKNEGITAASRNMPYGIQQAAISGQIAQLEEYLGVVLFQRRPFAITSQGQKLFDFIRPFFENVEALAEEIRGGEVQRLRVAASEIVLRDYLPGIIQRTRKQFPKLNVTLREGYHPEILKWLEQREVDLALGLLGGKTSGVHVNPLFDLPLVLMVPEKSRIKSPEDLWKQDPIKETLITTPTNQVICRAFEEGLAKRKLDWFSGIEVSTLTLAETYVVNGYGIAVTVGIPSQTYPAGIRILPLLDFPNVTFGVLWQGIRTPLLQSFLKTVEETVADMRATETVAGPATPASGPRKLAALPKQKAENARLGM